MHLDEVEMVQPGCQSQSPHNYSVANIRDGESSLRDRALHGQSLDISCQ